MTPSTQFTADDYVSIEKWGRDHWSMLAYFRTVEVDKAGFKVQFDPRMRQNRRNWRTMLEKLPKGKFVVGHAMDVGTGTRLNDDTFVSGHDDWCCVQDFAKAGLLTCNPDGVDHHKKLHLSELGASLAASVEQYKADGGSFSTFKVHDVGTLTCELIRGGKIIAKKVTQHPIVDNGVAGVLK